MDKNKYDLNKAWNDTQKQSSRGTLSLDTDKYKDYLEDFDLSKEQEAELLQILWSIMTAFVDVGFGVDSIQLLPKDDAPQKQLGDHEKKLSITAPQETPKDGL